MDYDLKIIPDQSLVVETITGEVTLEAMIGKTKMLFEDPNYDSSFSGVVDLRGAVNRMSKVELYGFAQLINESDQFGYAPWAVLASDPMLVALSQVFKLRLKDPKMIGVFSTVREAARFIKNLKILEYLHDEAVI